MYELDPMSSNTIFGYIIVVLSIDHQLVIFVQIKLSVSPQDGAEKNLEMTNKYLKIRQFFMSTGNRS